MQRQAIHIPLRRWLNISPFWIVFHITSHTVWTSDLWGWFTYQCGHWFMIAIVTLTWCSQSNIISYILWICWPIYLYLPLLGLLGPTNQGLKHWLSFCLTQIHRIHKQWSLIYGLLMSSLWPACWVQWNVMVSNLRQTHMYRFLG